MKGRTLSAIKLRDLTHFQNFDPERATEAALTLGKLSADIAHQDAADAWYLVASTIASGTSPPNPMYEGRVSGACRHLAKALDAHADAIDKTTEQQRLNVANAKRGSAAGGL